MRRGLSYAWWVVLAGVLTSVARAQETGLPQLFEVGRTYPIRMLVQNRAARLTIINAALLPKYGDFAAPQGKLFLVLSTEWENIIPLTLIQQNHVPTAYAVLNLADNLYLVINGSRLAQLRARADELPGHVPVRNFALPAIGAKLNGNLVFEAPASGIKSLQVRFYDFAHGNLVVPLTRPTSGEPPEAKPLAPAQTSEVLEVGAYGIRKDKELAGHKAPDGMTFMIVDVRARSLVVLDGDATAYDPKAKPGSKMKIGTVADWKDSRKYLQLVVDGEFGFAPMDDTALPQQPRFLPDVMTGGDVVFLAPENYQSLELRCDFPNAAIPGRGVIRPKGLTLALEGARPPPPPRAQIASVKDGVFDVSVVGQRVVGAFAGQNAGAGSRFLCLDVTVANTGSQGEFFQTRRQVKHAAENGAQSEFDPATLKGPHAPTDLLWIPPGERRTFEAVFKLPAKETKPRLAYTGISLAKILNLTPIDAAAVN